MSAKTGLASISQGRSDIMKVDPRLLHIKDNWNTRDQKSPENIEHVAMLAASIKEVGVREPLTVYWEDGKAYVTNGHCRLLACKQLIEDGEDIKAIPVKSEDRYSNEADRIFSQVLLNSGKPFTPLEQAKVFKKLLDLGWLQGDIAKKAGMTASRVSQVLSLLTLPEGVKAMVVAGNVSATLAVQTVTDQGPTEAEKALKAGLEVAKAEGKTKVKPAHIAEATETTEEVAPVKANGKLPNIRAAVIDAFEYADVDDESEEFVVIKMPVDKWEILKQVCKL